MTVATVQRPASAKPVRPRPKRADLRPTLGPLVCDWIETYLCHGPGDVQGQPLVLDDEYRAFIWKAYELFPKGHRLEGRRVYRRAFLSRPKGRAKSELAGAVVCAEAVGPVRFDGWDSRGRPVGRPVLSPVVKCYATEETQAGNTFDNAVYMLSEGFAADEYDLDVGLTRINVPATGGVIQMATAAAGSKDGGKETFAVFDETHLWISRAAHNLFGTVTRNITKRKLADGWVMETSTMYGPGEGSVAEETHGYAKTAGDEGLLFDHRQAPLDTDISDDVSLRAGLEYVYGPAAGWTNIDSIIRDEFRNATKSEADNRRYWLNQSWKRAERFVDPLLHAPLALPDRVVEPGTRVVIGFDGSKNRDATALVGWTVEARPHRFTIGLWVRPQDAPDDWKVPRLDVTARLRWAFATFKVLRVIADPPDWRSELEAWAEEFGEDRVVEFETYKMSLMAVACDRYDSALRSGAFSHDDDPVVNHHLYNCTTKTTGYGPVVTKSGREEKIDAGVATIIGYYGLSTVEAGGQGSVTVGSFREFAARFTPEEIAEKRKAHEAKVKAILDRAKDPR
jgi:phage terminase large subunit-like protein